MSVWYLTDLDPEDLSTTEQKVTKKVTKKVAKRKTTKKRAVSGRKYSGGQGGTPERPWYHPNGKRTHFWYAANQPEREYAVFTNERKDTTGRQMKTYSPEDNQLFHQTDNEWNQELG